MPYVTSIERLAREEGSGGPPRKAWQKGFRSRFSSSLELKFKKVPAKQARKLRSVRDLDRLETLLQAASTASTLDEAFLPIEE